MVKEMMLEECPDERRMFNTTVEVLGHGDPLFAIAKTLEIWSVMAPPNGSYGKQCAIMCNEILKVVKDE